MALPVAFMFAGIPLFMHGREITSLSFTALGFFLVLVAVVLAAASLIMLFKPGRKGDERSQRVQDRHWVMLQDKKKLEACLAEQEQQRQAVRAELAAMRPLFDDPAVIAVGEIGLDHHWPLPAQEQYDLFEAQLQLAQELDLPVSVHDREAHAEMYELLRQYRPRGVLHCYSGSAEDAAWLTAQGMALGFGGAVTYKGAKRAAKVLAMVPHELAVLETDCPYMSPEPVRGTRNDSRNIAHVAAKIGEIWQMDAQSVLDLTAENAKRIFNQ